MALRKPLAPDRSAPWSTKARACDSNRPSPKSRLASARRSLRRCAWENLGRAFAESFRIKTLTESNRIVFEPAEGFDEAARGAKPFIVCGLHLGNWDLWRMAASGIVNLS